MSAKRAILVTGSHRSGTTWVGKVIAEAPRIAYIHEPFNPHSRPGLCAARFSHWFTYVTAENEASYRRAIERTLSFQYDLLAEIKSWGESWPRRRTLLDCLSFLNNRILRKRPLVKDPIAVFSAEWLASTFDMDVIVLIRHPAGFAGSLKRLSWVYPFSHLLEQPLLMRDRLGPFAEEIGEFASGGRDIVDQAALLWKIIHHVIGRYREDHSDWTFVRLEDLAVDPVAGFRTLFERAGLEFTGAIERTVLSHTAPGRPADPGAKVHALKRHSREAVSLWRQQLNAEEIDRLRRRVEDVSKQFYAEEEW